MTPDDRTLVYRDRTRDHLIHSVHSEEVDDQSRVRMRCGKRVKLSSCILAFAKDSRFQVNCPKCLAVMALEADGWRLLP